jgi:hypothetical protein
MHPISLRRLTIGLLIFVGSLTLPVSCKKDKTPLYPQLIGAWSGETSQGNIISLEVINRDGTLYISKYQLPVNFQTGYQVLQQTNTRGIAALTGVTFNLPLGPTGSYGPAYIGGSFNLTAVPLVLTGEFTVYYPSSSVDVVTGSYTAYLH